MKLHCAGLLAFGNDKFVVNPDGNDQMREILTTALGNTPSTTVVPNELAGRISSWWDTLQTTEALYEHCNSLLEREEL